MLREYDVVIADTTVFILLDKINELSILKKIFGEVTTTIEVASEYGKMLPEWVTVKAVMHKHYQKFLEIELDVGEASAFALVVEYANPLLILDDYQARKLAKNLNFNYTGTLGILLKAKHLEIISALRPLLLKIQQTNFRMSEKVLDEILKEANE